MGRLSKIKRELIQEANRRLLNEDVECNCEHSDGIPCCGNSECPVYEVDGRMYVSFCETGCCRKNHGVGKTIGGVKDKDHPVNQDLLNEGKTCWYRNPHGSKPKCKATWEGSGSHGDKCMKRGECLGPRGDDNIVHGGCGDGGYCLTSQNCASNEGNLKKYSRCFQNCCVEDSPDNLYKGDSGGLHN